MSDSLDRGLTSDPTLIGKLASPPQVNLLSTYGDAAKTAEGIWHNRLYQAQQAQGEAAQGAIDQTTGAYSPERARQLNAATGQTGALGAQQALLNTQQLSDSQMQQAKAKIDWVNNAASALLDKGQISDADIMEVFKQGAANGMLTSGEIAKQTQLVMGLDQNGRQQWARQHQLQHVDAGTQLQRMYGTRPQVNAGRTTEFPTVPSPEKGGAPSVPMTTSPATGAELITIWKPDKVDADGAPAAGTTFHQDYTSGRLEQ